MLINNLLVGEVVEVWVVVVKVPVIVVDVVVVVVVAIVAIRNIPSVTTLGLLAFNDPSSFAIKYFP